MTIMKRKSLVTSTSKKGTDQKQVKGLNITYITGFFIKLNST